MLCPPDTAVCANSVVFRQARGELQAQGWSQPSDSQAHPHDKRGEYQRPHGDPEVDMMVYYDLIRRLEKQMREMTSSLSLTNDQCRIQQGQYTYLEKKVLDMVPRVNKMRKR